MGAIKEVKEFLIAAWNADDEEIRQLFETPDPVAIAIVDFFDRLRARLRLR